MKLRSRFGNAAMLVYGALCLASALALLAYDLVQTSGAGSLSERILQVALLMAAAIGALLALGAARNLNGHGAHRGRHDLGARLRGPLLPH